MHADSIVAHKTSIRQIVNLVLDTIKLAKKEMGTTELQFHSVQGLKYTSRGYFNLTKEYVILSPQYPAEETVKIMQW